MNTHAFETGYVGSLVADAVAMPVHWYYDTDALDRDYGELQGFVKPKNPHSGSILWRSSYDPPPNGIDILGEQARFWGERGRGIHYHQFLEAGENTVNFKLAAQLHELIVQENGYDSKHWLNRYIERMGQPEWHRDTYVEEYHRAFFTKLGQGVKPESCGLDDNHIGGLALVPALCAGLVKTGTSDPDVLRTTVAKHISLTHWNQGVLEAGDILTRLMTRLARGDDFETALREEANGVVSLRRFGEWSRHSDRDVIGRILSPACYIKDSFPAALYLAWKYKNDFSAGILANAHVGGDNCHRGVVVGALLGILNGVPAAWRDGLVHPPGSESAG